MAIPGAWACLKCVVNHGYTMGEPFFHKAFEKGPRQRSNAGSVRFSTNMCIPYYTFKAMVSGGGWYFLGRDPWRMSSILIGGLVISFDNWTLTIHNVNIDHQELELDQPKHGVLLQKSSTGWRHGGFLKLGYPKTMGFNAKIVRGLDGSGVPPWLRTPPYGENNTEAYGSWRKMVRLT